ncbi:hypothetical protein C8T65DRAFT_760615, partial [Cerioporus squamosus]
DLKSIEAVFGDLKDENALLLELQKHQKFDNFEWCLLETEVLTVHILICRQVPNTYTVQWFDETVRHWPGALAREVTFADRSEQHPGFALPSPLLLRWHAALAHVFHFSGVAELFGKLNGPPSGDGTAILSQSGDAFMAHVVIFDG